MYLHVAARLYFEANHVLVACVDKRLHLFCLHRQGVTHRHASRCVVLEVWYLGAFGLKLGGCVECYVCLACVEKHFYVFAVYVAAFALLVWSVRAAFAHAFVDAYSEPRKSLVDIVFGSRNETLGVGIFDSENHLAAMLTGEKIVVKRCADTAYVKRASGRGGEAHAHFSILSRHCYRMMGFVKQSQKYEIIRLNAKSPSSAGSEIIAEAESHDVAVYAHFFVPVAEFCERCDAHSAADSYLVVVGYVEAEAEAPHYVYMFPPVVEKIYGLAGKWRVEGEIGLKILSGADVEVDRRTGV